MATHVKMPHDGDFVYWFGRNLAAAGLLKNEPWVLSHAKEAYKVGESKGLGWLLACMSISHFRAIDYVQQAPLLGAGAFFKYRNEDARQFDNVGAGNQLMLPHSGYLNVAKDMAMVCKNKYNLKETYRYFGLNPVIRLIPRGAVTVHSIMTLNYLSAVHPSTVSQYAPRDPWVCKKWMSALSQWVSQVNRQGRVVLQPNDLGLTWLIKNLEPYSRGRAYPASVGDIADFFVVNHLNWNDRWTYQRALHEVERWHQTLASEEALRGIDPDRLIPYNDLPVLTELEGHKIEALNTYRKQHVEGAVQKHCLGSYGRRKQNSFFFSLKDGDDNRVSTFEISTAYGTLKNQYILIQHKGYRNTTPSRNADMLVHKFLANVNRPK